MRHTHLFNQKVPGAIEPEETLKKELKKDKAN